MAIKTDTFSSAGGGGAGTDNLDDVTSRGATTTNAITVGGVTVGTEYSLPTLDGSENQVLQTNGTGTLSFATLDFTGGLEYKGAFNATAGTPSLLNAEKGDFYIIDTAGTIYGQTWAVGDHLLINEDMGGAITNSKIDKIDNTDTPASETVAGVIEIATNAEAGAGTATDKALVPSNISSLDLSAMDNTTSAFIALGDIPTASHSTAGILETATNAEATSAIATDKILTPANLSHIDLSTFDNDAGFISGITGESLNDLSDVSFTAGAGIDNYVLTYDNSTTSWGAEAVPSATPASETVAGVIEIATNAEATAGTATDKALVPSNISSLDLSAMDNTTSAFISDITSESLNDLSDVSFTAGAGIDNYVLTYDNGTSSWGAEAVPSASPASETTAGIIEIATNAEATAGTATDKALVPSNISSLDLSAMDNTTSAFISDITSESLNDLSDVSFTAGAGIDNYVLTYDNGTSTWGAEAVPSATPASETVAGVIEIATNAEATAGTATDKALVPSNISSLDLSAMDNTTSAFISDITSESLNDLSDVSFTAGAGIDNYVLTYDNGTSTWGAEAVPSATPASETVAGVIEIATNAEATAGTATDKALVPSNISSLDLSAMDNTTSAFISDITSESLNDLSDVSFTAGAGIDNYVLTYDNGTSTWGAEAVPSATPASETVAGVIEIATNAEATAGTATDKALVPSNISSLDLSAMDNTTSAFISDITSESLNDLSDVSFTAGAGIDNYVLTYDNGTSTWGAEAVPSATPASETVAGVIEIATNAEATAGTATDKALVPSNISSLDLSAMDNTTSAFISDITSESLNDLSDVSFTAGAGIDNYVLTYDNGTSTWGAEAVPSATPASETVAGVIEIATNAEATAGTATDKALVPSNISSLDLSAMDNTTSAFISDITSESLNDLSDVSFTAGAGIDNYVLTYDNGTSTWGAEAVPSATPASETVAGVIEIATNAEATAGTATDKALVPSNLSSVDLSVLDNTTSAFITAGDIPTASETTAGIIEIATNAEAGAGTATDKALVPSNISSLDLSAMDNTTSAFISNITSESLNDLSDVSFTAGAGIDNYVLTYDHATTSWGAEAAAGGGGSAAPTVTSASPSANYTISTHADNEEIYLLNPSANISVFLPAASTCGSGYKYQIKNLSTNTITIDPNSTEYIDHSGQTTFQIIDQYTSITLVTDGSNWFII